MLRKYYTWSLPSISLTKLSKLGSQSAVAGIKVLASTFATFFTRRSWRPSEDGYGFSPVRLTWPSSVPCFLVALSISSGWSGAETERKATTSWWTTNQSKKRMKQKISTKCANQSINRTHSDYWLLVISYGCLLVHAVDVLREIGVTILRFDLLSIRQFNGNT